jgi:UDP-GlcNAc3NAcA epimerase
MKIITIVGARPQFIKAATLSRAFRNYRIEEIIIHTGQHYDSNLSDIFFNQMQIDKPKYFLEVKSKKHSEMTGKMMQKIEEILISEKPNWVVLFGDTNSTLAGALAASKLHIKIAHVEAGLRSFNMKMPEEINRILTDRVSTLLFCPTKTAVNNLKSEGFEGYNCKVINAGDIMNEGIKFFSTLAKKPLFEIDKNFILCTVHRPVNTDNVNNLKSIFKAVNYIGLGKQVVFPCHPRTLKVLKENNIDVSNIKMIEPIGYLEMVWLIKNCELIITDSGGLQKESYFFSKPCVVLRNETEWVELVDNKFNALAGSDFELIIEYVKNYKFNYNYKLNLYGDGSTSKIIIDSMLNNDLA